MAPCPLHLLDTISSLKPLTDYSSFRPGTMSFIVDLILTSLHGLAVALYSCMALLVWYICRLRGFGQNGLTRTACYASLLAGFPVLMDVRLFGEDARMWSHSVWLLVQLTAGCCSVALLLQHSDEQKELAAIRCVFTLLALFKIACISVLRSAAGARAWATHIDPLAFFFICLTFSPDVVCMLSRCRVVSHRV
ncbi:hypothetical protein WHR41_09327 [Cladosporium halotolerans]|uniref:Uncharacterized protein n=1 Tax=Cladosporium halotolerans TaxID=1052096 RepID=A0AB34KFB0_9PEZI